MAGWVRGLFRVVYRRKLAGEDLSGNKYYEAEALTSGRRPRRSVELQNVKRSVEYTQDSIPTEWQRWLRGLRDTPPSLEELERSDIQRQRMQKRVEEVATQELQNRAKEEETLKIISRTKATEHAAAPSFKDESEHEQEPTSTGKAFQPASWKP